MATVPQTVNCVDVLPRTSRHLHSHLLWTSLEPGHCHCAVCLMVPHMNIRKPSVNKSNTGVRTLISHHNRRTLVALKYCFSLSRKMREISTVQSESVRRIENAWVSRDMRETWQIFRLGAPQTVTNTVNVVVSKKWREIDTSLLHTTNRKYHMAYIGPIRSFPMTLETPEGHSRDAGHIKCNSTNICAIFRTVLTDTLSFLLANTKRTIHCVSKKQDTKLLPITSPNVNRFHHIAWMSTWCWVISPV